MIIQQIAKQQNAELADVHLLCMQAKDLLCCAVGRDWRWKMDDPLTIVSGAIDNHVKMINEYKGVPGVQPARLQEGFQVGPFTLLLADWEAVVEMA